MGRDVTTSFHDCDKRTRSA